MWNSPLLAYRTQKPHPAQTGQSQIPQSCLYQPAWEYTTWGGEWAVVGLCLGRHFQVQSSTFQGRKASPTSDYTFLFASSQIPLFLSSLSLFFFFLNQGYANTALSHSCCIKFHLFSEALIFT